MKYKDLSINFNKSWKMDKAKLDKMQSDFMAEIRNVLWHLTIDDESNPTEAMDSSYDAPMILANIQNLIEKFNEVYHIVSVTSHWEIDDDNNEKEIK